MSVSNRFVAARQENRHVGPVVGRSGRLYLHMPMAGMCPEPTVEEIGSSHPPGMPKMGKPTFVRRWSYFLS